MTRDNEARLRDHIFDSARNVASLEQDQADSSKSRDKFASSPFSSDSTVDREEPPKDEYRRYWRQFETTPIVREPITSFAREVVEPGFRVESPDLDEEQLRQLVNWLRTAGVMEGETDKNISSFIKKAVVQREVKGTVFIEKLGAKEKEDTLLGLKFIPPETMEVNKRPNQNIILFPDDVNNAEYEDIPTTEDGKAAGYTQTSPEASFGSASGGGDPVNFTKDEIIKLTRDADVGEALGTSRLESVSQRIEGLKNKLRDNDEAISSKAYPLWLFLFGSEEAPWDRDDIDSFMRAHEMDNFHPGMKQGVRGDVDVETISGEVSDIAQYLDFDVDWILSAMPKAKYTLGAFESNINQFVTQSQERDTQRQIKEARREIEAEFTPVVQQKANEMFGLSEEALKNVRFRLGSPAEEQIPQQQNVNVIRYIGGDVQSGQQQNAQSPQGGPQDNPQSQGQPQGQGQGQGQPQENPEEDTNVASEQGRALWEAELNEAELSDPRFTSTQNEKDALSGSVKNTFMTFRDDVLNELQRQHSGAPEHALASFSSMANARVNRTLREDRLKDKSSALMESVVKDTLETLGQNNQELSMDVPFTYRHKTQADSYASNVEAATRDALHEFVRRMRLHLRRGVNNGEQLGSIVQRIKNSFNDAELSQRSAIIAHMELQNAVESTKLNEFHMNDDVVAVKPINTCDASTSRVCADLSGCGSHRISVAKLDGEEELSDQWMKQVSDRVVQAGFNPLPANPPWHFGCTTELVPVTEAQLEEHEPKSGNAYTVEELEEKYGIEVEEE